MVITVNICMNKTARSVEQNIGKETEGDSEQLRTDADGLIPGSSVPSKSISTDYETCV
jgi:hypothetical protein